MSAKACPPCNQDCSQSDTCPNRLAAAPQAAPAPAPAPAPKVADSHPTGSLPDDFGQFIDGIFYRLLLSLTTVLTIAAVCGLAGYAYAKLVLAYA